MKTIIIAFLGVLVPMIALDAIWISATFKTFYVKYIGELLAPTPSAGPAVLFYLLYAAGIVFFVVLPALKGDYRLGQVFLSGAFLGLIAYGTYDLTNQTMLKVWSVSLTVSDMAWGAFLTGSVSAVSVCCTRLWS